MKVDSIEESLVATQLEKRTVKHRCIHSPTEDPRHRLKPSVASLSQGKIAATTLVVEETAKGLAAAAAAAVDGSGPFQQRRIMLP